MLINKTVIEFQGVGVYQKKLYTLTISAVMKIAKFSVLLSLGLR